ncbi:unnamed protein product, partial [Acanthocheilonema viteae]
MADSVSGRDLAGSLWTVNVVPTQRAGMMAASEARNEIIFLFGDLVSLHRLNVLVFPWLTPPKTCTAFWIEDRENIAFFIKFELQKRKYTNYSKLCAW